MTNKTWKRILCLLICIAMIFVVLPQDITISAESYSGTCGDNVDWEYDIDTATLTISGAGAIKNYSIKSYDGTAVTNAPWREYYNSINTVVIENGVTSIGESAFFGCIGLMSITISNSVTSIGGETFSSCSALASVKMSNSLSKIGWRAFADCIELKSIIIPNSVTSISSYAFYDCTGLGSIIIPNSVTRIEQGTFNGCSGLTSVTISNSVVSIGDYAFGGCVGLKGITIPNSVTTIGLAAFWGCKGLTSITIPDSVNWIDYGAFAACDNLQNIFVEAGNSTYHSANNCLIETYGKRIIAGCNNSVIPNDGSVIRIDRYAFSYCVGLESITIPHGVTTIISNAFCGCTRLKSITIPISVTYIGDAAFSGCTELKTVYYSDGTSCGTIEQWRKIDIGSDNTPLTSAKREYHLYAEDWQIGSVPTCTETGTEYRICSICGGADTRKIPKLGHSFLNGFCTRCGEYDPDIYVTGQCSASGSNTAFIINKRTGTLTICGTGELPGYWYGSISDWWDSNNSTIKTIVIGDGVTEISTTAFSSCNSIENIIVNGGNPIYYSSGNCLIKAESKTLILGCKSSIIPTDGSVTSIGEYAFSDCIGLTGIAIPDSVISIGDYAFRGCSGFTSVIIPDSVTSVGDYAFKDCIGIQSITIPNSVTSMGYSMLSGCSGIKEITLPFVGNKRHQASDTYQFPFGYIFGSSNYTGSMATNQCYYGSSNSSVMNTTYYIPSSLKKVTITDSVYITYGAFYNCSNIDWFKISDTVTETSDYAFYGCNIKTLVIAYGSKTVNKSMVVSRQTLENIIIPNSVTKIGNYAFCDCSELVSVTIPNGANLIGDYAFYDCTKLASVFLPDSVEKIGSCAFARCIPLVNVFYAGNEYKKESINIDNTFNGNDNLLYATWHCESKPKCEHLETVIKSASEATDTLPGYTGDVCCIICGEIIANGSIIPALENPLIPDENSPQIAVESKKTLTGKEFTLSVDLSKNSGLAYLKLALDYDSSAFELISATNAGLLGGTYTTSRTTDVKPYIIQWMGADNSTDDGNLLTFTFKAKDDATVGNYTIGLTVVEAYNEDYDEVAIAVQNGNIKVQNVMIGDFNGDGKINGKDGILCSQALAGWDVEYFELAADVNGDGKFNGKDGILLSQYLAGWDVVLG